jgi:hypothetical protein
MTPRSGCLPSFIVASEVGRLNVARKRFDDKTTAARLTPSALSHPLGMNQQAFGFGVRFGEDARQATALAENVMATLREDCGRQGGNTETCWVSHIPSHLHNSLNAKQRRCEGRAGTPASRQQPDYARSVCASGNAGKTIGTNQSGGNGVEPRESSGITGPYWTMAGIVHSLQVLEKNGGDDETRTRDLCRDRAP